MSTLGTLKADVAALTDRTDISVKVPLFAKLARLEIEATAIRPRFLMVKAASIPVNGSSFLLPTDAMAIQQVSLVTNNTTTILTRKTEAFVRLNNTIPKYYWRDANNGYLGRQPASTAYAEIDYYQAQADPIVNTDTNNWLLYAYDVFLHATLAQAYNYLKDLESAQLEQQIVAKLMKTRIDAFVALEHSDLSSAPGDL